MKPENSVTLNYCIFCGQPNSSYFNDDMALYGPLCPEDVIDDGVFVRFPTSEVELGCNKLLSWVNLGFKLKHRMTL